MAQALGGADELARLKAAQARVRELARAHDWLAEWFRRGFEGFLDLCARFHAEEAGLWERERRLARELLAGGHLFDPACADNRPRLFVTVEGLCPATLAARLSKHRPGDKMPDNLRRAGSAAALAALDRDTEYWARDLPDDRRAAMAAEYRAAIDAGVHVDFQWRIVVARPEDWKEPADPQSLDRTDLERFAEPDYRTIVLYRLGGLADAGALRPIVPKPKVAGDGVRDTAAYAKWRSRSPINDADRDRNDPPLNVAAFPPGVAEQMLADLETWVSNYQPPMSPPREEPNRKDGHARHLFPLCDEDVTLLMELAERNVLTRASDLDGKCGMPKYDRMVDRLRAMETADPPLVSRPGGPRSGFQITPAGREELQRRDTPPA